jgi:hypothetical protein
MKWVLTLFSMRSGQLILVSPLWVSTLEHITNGIVCV